MLKYSMRETNTNDQIDLELTRTYFGDASKNADLRDQKGPKGRAGHPTRRRFLLIMPLLITLIVLAGLIFLAIDFLDQKRLVFNISINIEPLARPATPVREPTPDASGPAALTEKDIHEQVQKKHTPRERTTLYDFEEDNGGWEIPAWALDKQDHVARTLKRTDIIASEGMGSLELYVEFPRGKWTAALIEIPQYLNFEGYDLLSADIYLPSGSPEGLKGKLILTVGERWQFVEMSLSIRLSPGEWTTISADISEDSIDWKRVEVDEIFKADIRKMAIRIESDGFFYSGPVYIDNIRVTSRAALTPEP